jgi:hypothetical protein
MKKRLQVVTGAAAILAVGLVSAILLRTYREYSDGTRKYADVTLGDTREEVRYRLGSPPVVFGKALGDTSGPWGDFQPLYYADPKRDPVNQLPKGTTDKDYDEWSYDPSSVSSLNVKFDMKTDRVIGIGCFDFSSTHSDCPSILGVNSGDSEASLFRKLGKPTRQVVKSGTKNVHYDDLGVDFVLGRAKVYGFGVRRDRSSPRPPFSRVLVGLL